MSWCQTSLLAATSLLLLLCPLPSAALKGSWLGQDGSQRTAARPELEWDWGHRWAGWSFNNQPLTPILSSIMGTYKFSLPRIDLMRGQAYVGAAIRLRRVVRQLLNLHADRPVKVGVIGGSISWGQGASSRGVTDWFSLLSRWMLAAFPKANLITRNGCTPGAPATYMTLCLELSVDPDVDLVFVEFTMDNGHDTGLDGNRVVQDMERLVRRLLMLPSSPAVVLMHVPTQLMASYPPGHPKNTERENHTRFFQTSEDAMGAVSQYYDVQALSLRTAMYDLAVRQEKPGYRWEDVFVDHLPGNQGHKFMADLAVHLLQQTVTGLIQVPFAVEDTEATRAPLGEPMYPGNLPLNSTCAMGASFRSLVQPSPPPGFLWIWEGTAEKPKPGYISTLPGSKLRIRLNTDRSGLGKADDKVRVYISYLRSNEDMGVATVSCVSGCNCQPQRVNGHHRQEVSQMYMVRLDVTQHPACEVDVHVLNDTDSGGHKFKVAGVVVSERPGDPGVMEALLAEDGSFRVREHSGDEKQIVVFREQKAEGG